MEKKLDMLEKIYETRELDFEEENKKDRQALSKMTHNIKGEEIEEKIKKALEKATDKNRNQEKEKIIEEIELLIENYEIQIAYYSQKNYKRGFKDAISLYTQCLKEEEE